MSCAAPGVRRARCCCDDVYQVCEQQRCRHVWPTPELAAVKGAQHRRRLHRPASCPAGLWRATATAHTAGCPVSRIPHRPTEYSLSIRPTSAPQIHTTPLTVQQVAGVYVGVAVQGGVLRLVGAVGGRGVGGRSRRKGWNTAYSGLDAWALRPSVKCSTQTSICRTVRASVAGQFGLVAWGSALSLTLRPHDG